MSPDGVRAYEVSVAASGRLAAIAWYGRRAEGDSVYFEWLTGEGRPRSAPVRVNDPRRAAYEPDLQLLGDHPVLVWYEKDAGKALTAWLAVLTPEGKAIVRARLNGAGGWARNPVVRVQGGRIDVAWIETPDGGKEEPRIWYQRFAPDGQPVAPPRPLAPASKDSWNLNAAIDPQGRFDIVYDAHTDSRANELHLLQVDRDAVHHVRLTRDDGFASRYPDLGFSRSGEAAITWFDERDGNDCAPANRMRQARQSR